MTNAIIFNVFIFLISMNYSNAAFKKFRNHIKNDQPPFNHSIADPKRPYFAIRELILEIHGDNKNFHSQHELPSTFFKHVDPHKSKHLWWHVKKTCETTWRRVKITEHHTAATVNIHKNRLMCWAGYKDRDVIGWSNHPWDVTFLRDKEALGVAPAAYWFTSKFNTDDHPAPPSEENNVREEL